MLPCGETSCRPATSMSCRRSAQRARSSWSTSQSIGWCYSVRCCTIDVRASWGSHWPTHWSHSRQSFALIAATWWSWQWSVVDWSAPPLARSTSTSPSVHSSSWRWTNAPRRCTRCTRTRSRWAQWCGGTSAGKWVAAFAIQWILYRQVRAVWRAQTTKSRNRKRDLVRCNCEWNGKKFNLICNYGYKNLLINKYNCRLEKQSDRVQKNE